MIFKAKRLTLQYHKNTLLGSWDNCTAVFFLSTGVHRPLFFIIFEAKDFFISNILYLGLTRCRRGIVKFSGLFVALRMGQPWEQPRPGVIWGREARRGRQAGRQGFGTPCVRGLRHSLHARPPRPCRDIRALRESLSPLSLRESLSPCRPAALPAWCLSFSFVRQHARARLLPWLRVARLFAFVPVFARKYAILSDL